MPEVLAAQAARRAPVAGRALAQRGQRRAVGDGLHVVQDAFNQGVAQGDQIGRREVLRRLALGQAMHWLLERVGPVGQQGEWPTAQCAAAARRFALDDAQFDQARAAARRILAGAGAWAWHDGELRQAFDEVELVHQGERLRIDRLVLRGASGGEPDAWWVLDYKSAVRPEQSPLLREQLTRYRDAVAVLHAGVRVRAAFLSADGRLVEID